MSVANICNSLVSTSSCYPDPTIKLHTLPLVEDENVTIVTSNVTQIPCQRNTRMLIAAVARHLWGNPLHQYLNAITIATNQAIVNTGAMSIFIMDGIDVENKRIATRPLTIKLPDGNKVMSTCDIHIPGLPTVLTGYIVPKVGCKVVFDINKCKVMYNDKIILTGYKDPSSDLWSLPIHTKVCTAPAPTIRP
jgi:hypothetical protein